MAAELTRESVFGAINSIFTAMLKLDLRIFEGYSAPSPGSVKITATVGLGGDWNGSATLECSGQTACFLAGTMLESHYERVDEDVKDVIGEITNMFAGNVGRLLPGSTSLSPPCVVEGSDYSMEILRTREAVKLTLECAGRHLVASVVERAVRRF